MVSNSHDNVEELLQKFPIRNPTRNDSTWETEIESAILRDFDLWNQGAGIWAAWADHYYSADSVFHTDAGDLALGPYEVEVLDAAETTQTTRLYFDNLLISGEWAAIHYRVSKTDIATGAREAGDVMQFLHFAKDGGGVKVIESWTK